jgi:hypothetical protein
MEQSQLIELIQTLNQAEKDLICQFATLPFFNQGKMKAFVPGLLDICLSHPWHKQEIFPDKKTVFYSIFPDQEFVEGKLEKTMAEAHKVVKTVLLVQQYLVEDNNFQLGFDFAKIVHSKGLESRYQLLLGRLQKSQTELLCKNEAYFDQQVKLENALHESECYYNQKKGDLNVPNVIQALEINYHIKRLAVLNRYLLQLKTTKIDVPAELLKHIEESTMPIRYLEESPVLYASHVVFLLLKKARPETSDIRTLFELLILNEKNFDRESLQEFYTYLRNICTLVLASDSENNVVETMLHELYQDNLKRGYLHYEGKLHSSRYWAVSSNALRVKDFDWALEFIEKYKHELIGENESLDIYRLNLANYLFHLGRFSECLDYIPATSPYVDYLLTGKRLELKAYYELKSDLFSFKLEAFKVFLSRTSPKFLSEAQKQSHQEFANLLLQLHLSLPGDEKRAGKVISRVQEKKQAAEWRWLLEKANALKHK